VKFPIPQDWDGTSWCRWSVCWPDSEGWSGFLRGLLTLPQRGWTWDERSGSILDVQAIGREITAQNLPLVGVVMSCNDTTLADSFNNIAAAIQLLANRQVGGGCCESPEITVNNSIQNFLNPGGGGSLIPVYGSSPPAAVPIGEFPAGYADYAAYDADKCRKANTMVTAMIASLRAFAAFEMAQFSGLTALTIMAIVGVLVVQPYLIPVLIAGLIGLGLAINVLDAAADDMVANYDDWVCALYTGNNVNGIITAIADLLDILVAAIGVTGVVGVFIKTIVLVLLNTDNLNKLFSDAPIVSMGPTDCAGCAWWVCEVGTVLASDATSVTVEGVDPGDFDFLTAVSYSDEETLGHLSAEVTGWIAPSDHPEFSSSWDTRESACGAGLGFGWENISGSPEAGPVLARTFQHRGNIPFTVKYTRLA